MGNLQKWLSADGGIILHIVDSTDIVREIERLHKTSATASAALGRVTTAAVLMGSMLKNEGDTVTLKIDGGGPVGSLLAVCDSECSVRATCINPLADLPLNPSNGKLNVGGIVGNDGTLSVIKTGKNMEQQIGQVELVSGEIAEDVTFYYAKSEQTPTVCALGVLVDRDLSILNAGGFLLQLLPGATDEEIDRIEKNIASTPSITMMLSSGKTITDIVYEVLDGFDPHEISRVDAKYRCNCSRDKMYRVLLSLGREELSRLAGEQEITEIVCSYCNKKYEFASAQLIKMSNSN